MPIKEVLLDVANTVFQLLNQPDVLRFLVVMSAIIAWVWSTKEGELVLVKNVIRKALRWANSMMYMVLAKDTKGIGAKYQIAGSEGDPRALAKTDYCEASKKTIIFIRHGESDWNLIFNKGKNPMMLVRLFLAFVREWMGVFGRDSPFLDSPLNDEGIDQAVELRAFIEADHQADSDRQREILQVLRGESGAASSIMVASNLRRAISTLTVAAWPRMVRANEKIHLLSYVQEISRNIDTCALSGIKEVPELPFSRIQQHCPGAGPGNFNASMNLGSKSTKFTGKQRIEAFQKWCFEQPQQYIIVGGHSLWFKYFFQLALPWDLQHRAKTDKMTNSGVVAFDLYKSNSGKQVCINPESLEVVYGGFTKK